MALWRPRAILGRLLSTEDDTPGRTPVAVLSYAAWKRLFNGDQQILGKAILLNGNTVTVAGVLGPEFRLNTEVLPSEGPMDNFEIFLPLPLGADAVRRRGDENYIAARIRQKDKRDRTFGMSVIGLKEQVVGDIRRALLVLLGSVALVLLSACANVANILLSRAAAREKEIAVRTALGAGWQRMVRHLLLESVLLSLIGGAAGLVLAEGALSVVRAIHPGNIPRIDEIGIGGGVLAFTFGVSLATGIVFGLVPAWRATKVDLNSALRSGG